MCDTSGGVFSSRELVVFEVKYRLLEFGRPYCDLTASTAMAISNVPFFLEGSSTQRISWLNVGRHDPTSVSLSIWRIVAMF